MHQLGRRAEVADSQRDRICAPVAFVNDIGEMRHYQVTLASNK
jgi:hypothetical protein